MFNLLINNVHFDLICSLRPSTEPTSIPDGLPIIHWPKLDQKLKNVIESIQPPF